MADEQTIEVLALVCAGGPEVSVARGQRLVLPQHLLGSMIAKGDVVAWREGLTLEVADAEAAAMLVKGPAAAREVARSPMAAARETAGQ